MKRLLHISLFVLISTACWAGWSTDAWPSQTHPRAGDRQDWDLQQAILERGYALFGCGYYLIDDIVAISNAFSWTRSEYENVTMAKLLIEPMVPYFVNMETIDIEGGFVTNYTSASILTSCHAPLNYFEHSFIRSLKGAGPLDTDLAAAPGDKGTNYPAGQTEWYQFNYGKHVLTNILNRMWYVRMTGEWYRCSSESNVLEIATNVYRSVKLAYTWTNSPFEYKSHIEEWDELSWSDPSSINGWNSIKEFTDDQRPVKPFTREENATPCAYWKSEGSMTLQSWGVDEMPGGLTNYWALHRLSYEGTRRTVVNDWRVNFVLADNVPSCDFDVYIDFVPLNSTSSASWVPVDEYGETNWANYFHCGGVIQGYIDTYTQNHRDTHDALGSMFEEDKVYGDLSDATYSEFAYTEPIATQLCLVSNVGPSDLRCEFPSAPPLYDADNFGMTWAETVGTTSAYANVEELVRDTGFIGWDLDRLPGSVLTLVDFTRGYDYK